MPTVSASTYASSVDITWPPVTYQYPPPISANGKSANNTQRTHRRRSDRGAFAGEGGPADLSGCARNASRLAVGVLAVSAGAKSNVTSSGTASSFDT
jgi:hypothetical protein